MGDVAAPVWGEKRDFFVLKELTKALTAYRSEGEGVLISRPGRVENQRY